MEPTEIQEIESNQTLSILKLDNLFTELPFSESGLLSIEFDIFMAILLITQMEYRKRQKESNKTDADFECSLPYEELKIMINRPAHHDSILFTYIESTKDKVSQIANIETHMQSENRSFHFEKKIFVAWSNDKESRMIHWIMSNEVMRNIFGSDSAFTLLALDELSSLKMQKIRSRLFLMQLMRWNSSGRLFVNDIPVFAKNIGISQKKIDSGHFLDEMRKVVDDIEQNTSVSDIKISLRKDRRKRGKYNAIEFSWTPISRIKKIAKSEKQQAIEDKTADDKQLAAKINKSLADGTYSRYESPVRWLSDEDYEDLCKEYSYGTVCHCIGQILNHPEWKKIHESTWKAEYGDEGSINGKADWRSVPGVRIKCIDYLANNSDKGNTVFVPANGKKKNCFNDFEQRELDDDEWDEEEEKLLQISRRTTNRNEGIKNNDDI